MKYNKVVIEKFGGPEVLKLKSFYSHQIESNKVGVRVLAAGVGFADIMAQRGGYILARKTPLTPGYDFVGIIEETGNYVSEFNKGDYVAALKPDLGCYSEYIEINQDYLVKVPNQIPPEKAVSLVLNYLTAACLLNKKAKIQKKETVLIHAAAGGVGTALIQLGKLLDLKMYGTASKKKHPFLKSYNVRPIDYQNEDFVDFILHSDDSGVDVVVDSFGGDYIKRSYKCLRKKGRLICMGFSGSSFGGYLPSILGLLQIIKYKAIPDTKKVMICATPNEVKTDRTWYKKELNDLFLKYTKNELDPVIGEVLPFDQVVQAHKMIENASIVGKVVLRMKD